MREGSSRDRKGELELPTLRDSIKSACVFRVFFQYEAFNTVFTTNFQGFDSPRLHQLAPGDKRRRGPGCLH